MVGSDMNDSHGADANVTPAYRKAQSSLGVSVTSSISRNCVGGPTQASTHLVHTYSLTNIDVPLSG